MEVLYLREDVHEKIAKFTEKDLYWSPFFIEKKLRLRFYPVNF